MNWEISTVPKILEGEVYFELSFQFFKKNDLGLLKKRQQEYLGEKEGETISAIRISVFHDAENLGLVPILELIFEKESTLERCLPTATICMT